MNRCLCCGDWEDDAALTYTFGLCPRCAPDALRELDRVLAEFAKEEDAEMALEVPCLAR